MRVFVHILSVLLFPFAVTVIAFKFFSIFLLALFMIPLCIVMEVTERTGKFIGRFI
jgi:hypothetical protein